MEPEKLRLKRRDFLQGNELDARIYGYIARGFDEGKDFTFTLRVEKGHPATLSLFVKDPKYRIKAKCLARTARLEKLVRLKKEVADELATVADNENFRLVLEYEPEENENSKA